MLKGFFYRRKTENNPLTTDIHIRFEINSKESILAKVTNLSQEGIQFLLPRGKVILVPDERILLVLNSPEHGEFKIQSDVYYFCNIIDQTESQLVCYGVKFNELSSSNWEVVKEFCGVQLPELAFLFYPFDANTAKKAAERQEIPPQPTVIPGPVTSFIPATPIIPADTPAAVPALTPALKAVEKSDRPIDTMIDNLPETTPSLPKDPVKAKTQSIVIPVSSAPTATVKEMASVASFLSPIPTLASFSTTAPMTWKQSPVKPGLNPAQTSPAYSTTAPAAREESPVKPGLNPAQTSPAYSTTAPAAREESPSKSKPSPIQVLAASLAAPSTPHTQPTAQSLSQEMIDRLIEKLQVEQDEGSINNPQSVLADSTPNHNNPIPDYLRVTTSDLNSTSQSVHDSIKPSERLQKQTGDLKQPETQTNDPKLPEASTPVGMAPFNPFAPFKFNPNKANESKTQTNGPKLAKEPVIAATAPFDPFAPFTLPSDNNISEAIQSDGKSALPADFNQNAPNPPAPATASFEGKSLADLMFNLDSTINKSSPSVPEKSILATKGTLSNLTTEGATANISLAELKKIDLPYSSTEPLRNTLTSNKKSVVPITADIPTTPMGNPTEVTFSPARTHEEPITPGTKTPSLGSTIIPNASGVSLDQKAIDKLVVSLLQDMPEDEPISHSKQTRPVLPNSSLVKNGTDAKVNSKAQPENGLSHNTIKGLNIFNTDPANNRVMDQKSIDVIVKTLTESEPNPVTPQPGQPIPANATPLKSFSPQEPKRTLDQKAIDQVVQALTQNFSTKNNNAASGSQTVTPFGNNKMNSNPTKTTDFTKQERDATFSLASLRASLHLENGDMLQATVEQIYVGGLMVAIEEELPLNSSLKLNLFGDNIRITEVMGTCTNCEVNPAGKTRFLAEIFFKNMSNTHMEQFRTLIAKLDIKH